MSDQRISRPVDPAPPGGRVQRRPWSKLAFAGLILSVLAALIWMPLGLMGAILSILSLRGIIRRGRRGLWLAIPGIAIGLGVWVLVQVRLLVLHG